MSTSVLRRHYLEEQKLSIEEKVSKDSFWWDSHCPRCGRGIAYGDLVALSRYADVSICDNCGTDEALRDFTGDILDYDDWKILQTVV